MSSPRGRRRLRLAHRAPDMANVSDSGVIEDNGPFVVNNPSSLTECTPVNITWTGGTPPYTLQADFSLIDPISSLNFEPEVIATNITATHFLWDNTVLSGMQVLLEVVDALGVHEVAPNPVLVGINTGPACSEFIPKILFSSRTVAIPTSSTSSSTFSTSSVQAGITISTTTITPLISPSATAFPSTAQGAPQRTLSGSAIALIVVAVVVIVLLGSSLLWRYCTMATGWHEGREDTEKQGGDNGDNGDEYYTQPAELWGSDAEWIGGSSIAGGSEDRPISPMQNPFETPENVVYPVEQIFSASPVSEAGAGLRDRSPPPPRSPTISSSRSSIRAIQVDNAVPGQGAPPLGPKARTVRRLPEQTPSVSTLSEGSSARMSTLSDADAARFSTSTSSTLPPSYRTRRSTGSIYVPTGTDLQNCPAFPPPAYTPAPRQGTGRSAPTRVPRRRVPAPVPNKVRDEAQTLNTSTSARSSISYTWGEREPSTYGMRDEGRIEGLVTEEEDADTDFSRRGRDRSVSDDSSASEVDMDMLGVVDSIGETGTATAVRDGTERTS